MKNISFLCLRYSDYLKQSTSCSQMYYISVNVAKFNLQPWNAYLAVWNSTCTSVFLKYCNFRWPMEIVRTNTEDSLYSGVFLLYRKSTAYVLYSNYLKWHVPIFLTSATGLPSIVSNRKPICTTLVTMGDFFSLRI